MTLPTGAIALSQVNTELNRPATQNIQMNDSAVRGLAGKPSGAVDMNSLRGKSARTVSITTLESGSNATGPQTRADYIIFKLSVSDGTAPSSYYWQDGSGGSTWRFDGPSYNTTGFIRIQSDTAYCTAVVAGQTYNLSLNYFYTAGDET